VLAQEESRRLRHHYLGTEHLLLGVLGVRGAPGARALARFGLGVDAVRADVARIIGIGPERIGEDDAEALRTIGIDLDEVRQRVEEEFGPGALDWPPVTCRDTDTRAPRGGSRSPRGPRRCWSSGSGRPSTCAASTSGPSTSYWGSSEGDGVGARILGDHGASSEAIRAAVTDELRSAQPGPS
jgi:hypothetical protein